MDGELGYKGGGSSTTAADGDTMGKSFADSTRLQALWQRRQWLRAAGLSLGGVTMPWLPVRPAAANEIGPRGFGRAKNCIVLFMGGGPPQHETWDPKPDASLEIRGDLRPIATSVPGLQVGELMPKLAAQAHRWAVLRAMQTKDNAHSASGYYMLTGQAHQPKNQENSTARFPNLWPSVGAVVNRLLPPRDKFPGAVTLPEHLWNNGMIVWPGQDAGFLGRAWDPWLIKCDPSNADFQVTGLTPVDGVSRERLDDRLGVLDQLNRRAAADAGDYKDHDIWSHKALDLLSSANSRKAFDLSQESHATRQRYGQHRFGQSVLLARRLIESGVSLVQVNWTRSGDINSSSPMWDTHQKNSHLLKTELMPPMDAACSALIDDLHDRGLLDETLVVWMGEFGRTPKINPSGGRDHWGNVFSVALAGGGIQGGVVHGASDALGAYPKHGIVQPEDLLTTIFHCLGLNADLTITDTQGRPAPIARGETIRAIL